MKTCKDCIYRAMCYKHEHYGYEDNETCEMFKNKADFVEVKCELQILTGTDGEPYMVIAKGNQAKYLVELMQKR